MASATGFHTVQVQFPEQSIRRIGLILIVHKVCGFVQRGLENAADTIRTYLQFRWS